MRLHRLAIILVVEVVFGACVDTDSNTDLVTAGPPEIAQVRLNEAYTDASGAPGVRRVFAFGTHPTATSDEEHPVTTAAASGQVLRIIMDQLVRGNRLEQIQCRDVVAIDGNGNQTAFSDVPDDATPPDIAKCAVSDAALPQSCVGDHLSCICQIQSGCDGIAFGAPVGVLDNNDDGAADNMQLKPGAVAITCGTGGSIPVPIDLADSYWNPSGNQLVPAAGGSDALGPAIVLVPEGGYLPTNTTCGLTFAPTVVDEKNLEVCAVPGGRPAACTGRLADCPQFLAGCTPGDTTAFSFGVQALAIISPITDGETGVSLTLPEFFTANAPLLASSIANITITPAPPGGVSITLPMPSQIEMMFLGGLAPSTQYTITIPTSLTDQFGQGLPAPLVITFTSASM
ncbi:MAG TPA: Ig-like domain-containing protein [Kofleriaceae bacterium]|jgi:hypothetical protein